MTLKQQIESNDSRLKQYKDFLDAIDLLEQSKDDKKAIAFLLDVQKLEFSGRVERGEAEQERLKKQYMVVFEQESAEANSQIDKIIELLKKYVGKEPRGVTDKIQPLIMEYNLLKNSEAGLSQEKRNEIYFELKGHYMFLTKKMK